jgi:hypothetical protein
MHERIVATALPALSFSEVVTLDILGQWTSFESEQSFYRYAKVT